MRANNRLVLGCDPNLLIAQDLTETRLPDDILADYARLLAGRRVTPSGATVPLKADELAELCRSLHARAPELFN